ncbi:methionyl-tRNA formyltransferase [Candidatus Giovannonibacteria bacterium RIFCSPLOWO2_02_FULL_45_14]|uniref:methionyl-tRNA formyltransferase n=1 Tax=Candidatus Giovannonibacteria bacterium RIFCSPLOWO2_12_FULL_44_15 TaxID=1798364 RepID=A0A1F5XZR3_9BACT|nr:MAG: methionyl-tRNA formyltransferase [Candidatus Giovannonibacteria bacterium RIFCSPHIGHO2_02_FULL_44_31]OGF75968.1 MAG: methionyl-tRNA formyltransferase [Candidatus Giovannonibacteria bacterium RIFCSPHIGHO2_12_FULL_44_29]OGF90861.1 MAG: methionyl-tRNA formyltransferase [Candidatus Giovannonibacteria bacterium RIFCSPLOWO2_02_FULL_45_14]OGF93408.1 MAG: methionyl-tRNA formyltransferase [Candidatus Giovannonibacteria bacterium RIFCSPLOWO2_12_FULL_44_15]
MKIVFFGNPKFAPFYLAALNGAGHEIVGIEGAPDLGVIAYYGKIIPRKTLEIPKHGFINIHPSLLPRYRGPSPVRTAILAGDKITGVTIHITVPKVDAGPIIAQKEFPINPEDNYEALEEKLFREAAGMLPRAIEDWLSGKIILKEQDESKATYTKIIKTEDGHINWGRTPEEILRQIRALSPNPGVFTFFEKKRLLILKAKTEIYPNEKSPGEVIKTSAGFKISCKNGFLIPLRVKLEGKKETAPEAFLHGHRDIIGKILT